MDEITCKDCKWHDDCICVVCEDGDSVVCLLFKKHVNKGYHCARSEAQQGQTGEVNADSL